MIDYTYCIVQKNPWDMYCTKPCVRGWATLWIFAERLSQSPKKLSKSLQCCGLHQKFAKKIRDATKTANVLSFVLYSSY